MLRRIGIPERIVPRIGVAVEVLRVTRIRHDRIGRDEAAEYGVIVQGFIEIEVAARIQFLARVLVVHIDRKCDCKTWVTSP